MKEMYFTIAGCNHYYGSDFMEKGMKVKEPDNEYDNEAIQVKIKGLGKVGYVANSPYTVKAYNLPCDYVIHTVGPIWNGGRNREEELLANCYFNSMKLAMDNGIRSIAFPSISTGAYGFPVELAANIAVHTVNRFLQDNLNSFDLVEWVLFDTHTESVYEAAEKSYMEDESDDFDF